MFTGTFAFVFIALMSDVSDGPRAQRARFSTQRRWLGGVGPHNLGNEGFGRWVQRSVRALERSIDFPKSWLAKQKIHDLHGVQRQHDAGSHAQ